MENPSYIFVCYSMASHFFLTGCYKSAMCCLSSASNYIRKHKTVVYHKIVCIRLFFQQKGNGIKRKKYNLDSITYQLAFTGISVLYWKVYLLVCWTLLFLLLLMMLSCSFKYFELLPLLISYHFLAFSNLRLKLYVCLTLW